MDYNRQIRRSSKRSIPWSTGVIATALILLLIRAPAFGNETSLAESISQLAREYKAQVRLAKDEQVFELALSRAARTWHLTALDLAKTGNNPEAIRFLSATLAAYQQETAQANNPPTQQLAAMNLFYQAVNVLAHLLVNARADHQALQNIQATEKRIMEVVKRAGAGGTAMAALSGGIMTMLAVAAKQVDRQGRMADTIASEMEQRRQIDNNISRLRDIHPNRQILLLLNNHLYGALSMVQVIGLTRAPELRPAMRSIEMDLLKAKNESVDFQILAGAKALAGTGFLAAPGLAGFAADGSANRP